MFHRTNRLIDHNMFVQENRRADFSQVRRSYSIWIALVFLLLSVLGILGAGASDLGVHARPSQLAATLTNQPTANVGNLKDTPQAVEAIFAGRTGDRTDEAGPCSGACHAQCSPACSSAVVASASGAASPQAVPGYWPSGDFRLSDDGLISGLIRPPNFHLI